MTISALKAIKEALKMESSKDVLSFPVKKSQVLGSLGTNGAGKSGNIIMISGYISPQARTTMQTYIEIEKSSICHGPAMIGYIPRITILAAANRLTLREKLDLFFQVCASVQEIHQNKAIHRDLKPCNIFPSNQNRQSLPETIDFGLARSVERSAADEKAWLSDWQFGETLSYMNPEQASGGEIDSRSDIYLLGLLLFYTIVSGKIPFGDESPVLTFPKLLTLRYPRSSQKSIGPNEEPTKQVMHILFLIYSLQDRLLHSANTFMERILRGTCLAQPIIQDSEVLILSERTEDFDTNQKYAEPTFPSLIDNRLDDISGKVWEWTSDRIFDLSISRGAGVKNLEKVNHRKDVALDGRIISSDNLFVASAKESDEGVHIRKPATKTRFSSEANESPRNDSWKVGEPLDIFLSDERSNRSKTSAVHVSLMHQALIRLKCLLFKCSLKKDYASSSLVNDIPQMGFSTQACSEILRTIRRSYRRADPFKSQFGRIVYILIRNAGDFSRWKHRPEIIRKALTLVGNIRFDSDEAFVQVLNVFGCAWNILEAASKAHIKFDCDEAEISVRNLIEGFNIEIISVKIPRIKACAVKCRDREAIFVDELTDSKLISFVLLHEFAHLHLMHSGLPMAFFSVEGMSELQDNSHCQEELEANVFAKVVLGLLKDFHKQKDGKNLSKTFTLKKPLDLCASD